MIHINQHKKNSEAKYIALIHWQPFPEMNSLPRDMNRLFKALAPMEQESSSIQQSFMPLAEMVETEDAIILE